MFLADMQEVKETVRAGYEIAKEAVTAFQAENGKEIPVFIGADLGPIYDLDHQDYDNVLQEYKEICDTFLSCGADCFVFETQSDFTYIEPVTAYIKENQTHLFWCSLRLTRVDTPAQVSPCSVWQ